MEIKTYSKIDLGKCCFCGLCEDICPKDYINLTKNVFLSTFDPSTVIKEPPPTIGGGKEKNNVLVELFLLKLNKYC